MKPMIHQGTPGVKTGVARYYVGIDPDIEKSGLVLVDKQENRITHAEALDISGLSVFCVCSFRSIALIWGRWWWSCRTATKAAIGIPIATLRKWRNRVSILLYARRCWARPLLWAAIPAYVMRPPGISVPLRRVWACLYWGRNPFKSIGAVRTARSHRPRPRHL